MYQDFKCTCRAIVLLIKPFVCWRSRCRCRRSLLKVPIQNSSEALSVKNPAFVGEGAAMIVDTSIAGESGWEVCDKKSDVLTVRKWKRLRDIVPIREHWMLIKTFGTFVSDNNRSFFLNSLSWAKYNLYKLCDLLSGHNSAFATWKLFN